MGMESTIPNSPISEARPSLETASACVFAFLESIYAEACFGMAFRTVARSHPADFRRGRHRARRIRNRPTSCTSADAIRSQNIRCSPDEHICVRQDVLGRYTEKGAPYTRNSRHAKVRPLNPAHATLQRKSASPAHQKHQVRARAVTQEYMGRIKLCDVLMTSRVTHPR